MKRTGSRHIGRVEPPVSQVNGLPEISQALRSLLDRRNFLLLDRGIDFPKWQRAPILMSVRAESILLDGMDGSANEDGDCSN